jgi:hypothetical protein
MSAAVQLDLAQGLVDRIAAAIKIGGRGGLALRPARPCWTRENTIRRLGVPHEFGRVLRHGPARRPGRRVWESDGVVGTLHRCSWCGSPKLVIAAAGDRPAETVYDVFDPRYAECVDEANSRANRTSPWLAWRREAQAAADSALAGGQLGQLLERVQADYDRTVAERGCAR